MAPMSRMNPLDASFLAVEDAVNHMHIGGVTIFEGPPPDYGELCDMIGSRLVLVPRYRQKVLTAPANIGRPVWVDDPHFELTYHVRHTALPSPGGASELRHLVGRVMAQQLDRHKPLWETWVVEGLDDGHWALVTKVHHCMVDGVSGNDLLAVLLDVTPETAAGPPDEWAPEPEPSVWQLVRHSLSGLTATPAGWARGALSLLRDPAAAADRIATVARGLAPLAPLVRPAPDSSLTGPIGPHRRWDWARTTFADVKVVREAFGGTVNDVVLAAITRGYRDLLLSRGEAVEGRAVRTLVPVSVRAPDARGVFDNRVAAMIAQLPVGIADPVERLTTLREELDALKALHEAEATETLMGLADFAPPMLLAAATRAAVHQQHSVETVTTNVPGPNFPLYAVGRRMLEAYPYVPLAGKIRVGVAIWSYLGGIHFGVTGDWDGAPDIEVLCAGIEDAMRELLKAAGDATGPDPAPPHS